MLTNLFGGLGAGGFGDGGAALSCTLVDVPRAACLSSSATQNTTPVFKCANLQPKCLSVPALQRGDLIVKHQFCMPLATVNDLQAAAGSCIRGRAMASGRCAPLHQSALEDCPVTCRTCSSPCQMLQGSLAGLFVGLMVLLQQMGLLSLSPLCTSRNVGSCRLQTTQSTLKSLMPS